MAEVAEMLEAEVAEMLEAKVASTEQYQSTAVMLLLYKLACSH